MMIPGSRTFLCYGGRHHLHWADHAPQPRMPGGYRAEWTHPAVQLVRRRQPFGPLPAVGRWAFIPDGKLCSGNSNYYDFSGFDQASPDWPKTHLTSGGHHPESGTTSGAAPPRHLVPVHHEGRLGPHQAPDLGPTCRACRSPRAPNPPSVGNPGSIDSYYYWKRHAARRTRPVTTLSTRCGARSDSVETFLRLLRRGVRRRQRPRSTGIGRDPLRRPPPTAMQCDPTRSPKPGRAASLGQVTVSNPTTSTMNGWTVSWVMANGEAITNSWNGTLSQARITRHDDQRQLEQRCSPPAAAPRFGFTANEASSPVVPASVSCQSP